MLKTMSAKNIAAYNQIKTNKPSAQSKHANKKQERVTPSWAKPKSFHATVDPLSIGPSEYDAFSTGKLAKHAGEKVGGRFSFI